LKYGDVKGGMESVYEVQERVIKKTKEHSKEATEWELGSECMRGKRLCMY